MLGDGNHFTFFSESHATTSWIDHCLSTVQGHNSISDVSIFHDFHTSDHFPLCISIDVGSLPHFDLDHDTPASHCKWHLAKPYNIESYRVKSDDLLNKLVIPTHLLHCSDVNCNDSNHCNDINLLYNNIVSNLCRAAETTIPHSNEKKHFNVPGWNDFVKAAHDEARWAFKLWVSVSKPKQGHIFRKMQATRAHFKYALRWCRNNERIAQADALATDLINKNDCRFSIFGSMLNSRLLVVFHLLILSGEPLAIKI